MNIKQALESEIEQWGQLGHPALQQRFVLEKGRKFFGHTRPKHLPRMTPKNCFQNSHALAQESTLKYVEGYAISPHAPLLVHHAWCVDHLHRVVDVTWDAPERSFYFGVKIDRETMERETDRTGSYSVLSGEIRINDTFIFEQCPHLREFVSDAWIAKKRQNTDAILRKQAAHHALEKQNG